MPKTDSKTKICGIIGNPIEHSLSPAMHNAAYEKLGLNFSYVAFKVESEDLEKTLNGIRAEGIVGINVTIPHKEAVIPFLDDVTKHAQLIGAVNTIKSERGKLIGYNTDAPGFLDSLKEDAHFDPQGKNAIMLGAGGAAKAVGISLAEAGAKNLLITDIVIEKAQNLAEYIAADFNIETDFCSPTDEKLKEEIVKAGLLINASPLGMRPNIDSCALPEEIGIPANILVFDLVYIPAKTKLLERAEKAGAKTINGLDMLVRQGALAFTVFTGQNAPLDAMKQAAEKELHL